MRIDLREIIQNPGNSIPFSCDLAVDELSSPSILSYLVVPHAEGRVVNRAGVLRLEGKIFSRMLCTCDRCSRLFEKEKTVGLSAVLAQRTEDNEEDSELFFLEGSEIDLDDVLQTLYILEMDMKYLCREDCKGICPQCGKDLNDGPCSCKKPKDPRFAVLEQLLDN